MTDATRFATPHDHVFLGDNHRRNERRTWLVIIITAAMMVIEITPGSLFGSMALVADARASRRNALRPTSPQAAEVYKAKLTGIHDLSHVTIEVQAA